MIFWVASAIGGLVIFDNACKWLCPDYPEQTDEEKARAAERDKDNDPW